MTKEKTRKHRRLFEAIHNDDLSALSFIDLAPLLKGTGVSMMSELPQQLISKLNSYDAKQVVIKQTNDKMLEKINGNLERYFASQKGQETTQTMPDGSIVTKKGNTTRIVRRRKI